MKDGIFEAGDDLESYYEVYFRGQYIGNAIDWFEAKSVYASAERGAK